jgi:hypothetical protein
MEVPAQVHHRVTGVKIEVDVFVKGPTARDNLFSALLDHLASDGIMRQLRGVAIGK